MSLSVVTEKALHLFDRFFSHFKLKKIIFIESLPLYTDNSKYVFDEMIRQKLNFEYKIYWNVFTHDKTALNNYRNLKKELEKYKNVFVINSYTGNIFHDLYAKILKSYVFNVARIYIICNHHIEKKKESQIYVNLTHGSPLKNIKNHGYGAPVWTDYVVRISDMFEENLQEPELNKAQYVTLGYPRNDELFKEPLNLKNIFGNRNFEKAIYWMPTWRQHNLNGKSLTSSSAVPIINDIDKAVKVNEYAKEKNVLIILKPHFSQDITKFESFELSNIVFIDNDFLADNNILNYELLRSVDAMISDYSSVYYDYLLCDKPIGLCWEDFDEFNKNEGFVVDVNEVLSGGEKLYNVEDLCLFIDNISKGADLLKNERHKNRELVHKYIDNQSSKRVADFIISLIK